MTLSDNIRSALLIMASMAAFTVNDALMKLAAPGLPFFQQVFLRGCMICIGLWALAGIWGHMAHRPSRRDRGLMAIRTMAEALGTVLFLTALFSMPLAHLSAILQALPLTVTLAAAVFLGEGVGWRRLLAILVGFVGVAIIIRPGFEGFTVYSLFGVGAVIAVTFRDLAARRLSASIPSSRVALSAAVGVTLLAGVATVLRQESWVIPSLREGALLAGAAGCLMVGYIAAVAGMRLGDIGFVAPFRYTSLLVALILGWVIFGDWPDELTLLGAAIVVTTGLFTLFRERGAQRTSSGLPAKGLRIR